MTTIEHEVTARDLALSKPLGEDLRLDRNHQAMNMDDTRMLLYVAGYARSGSTFLDSVLGTHPGVFSAGELTHLYDDACAGEPCGCGVSLTTCELWGPVLRDVGADLRTGRDLTRRVEHGWAGLRQGRVALGEYEHLWREVLDAVRTRSGSNVIVDASKTMLFAARRPARLHAMTGGQMRVLHLTRDPRASAWSVRKGGNQIAASRRLKALAPWRTAGTWMAANLVAEHALDRYAGIRLRYEDLVTRPRDQLDRVGSLTGLDFADVAERLVSGQELPRGHGLSGNRMRRGSLVTLRPDHEWRSSAPRSVLLAATLTSPLARRYGY